MKRAFVVGDLVLLKKQASVYTEMCLRPGMAYPVIEILSSEVYVKTSCRHGRHSVWSGYVKLAIPPKAKGIMKPDPFFANPDIDP